MHFWKCTTGTGCNLMPPTWGSDFFSPSKNQIKYHRAHSSLPTLSSAFKRGRDRSATQITCSHQASNNFQLGQETARTQPRFSVCPYVRRLTFTTKNAQLTSLRFERIWITWWYRRDLETKTHVKPFSLQEDAGSLSVVRTIRRGHFFSNPAAYSNSRNN